MTTGFCRDPVVPADRAQARAAVEALCDSPMQRRLRAEHDVFSAVVVWQPGDLDAGWLRRQLTTIRELGFNAVRYHNARPVERPDGTLDFTTPDLWMDTAAECGLRAIQAIDGFTATPRQLARVGLTPQQFKTLAPDDPRYAAVVREYLGPIIERYAKHPALYLWAALGEPHPGEGELLPEDRPRFAAWLRQRYGTVEALERAWNIYPERARPLVTSFDDAWRGLEGFRAELTISGVHRASMIYGAAADLLRYLTEKGVEQGRRLVNVVREMDPVHPISTGSHQLFVNQALLRWDIGRWARLADLHTTSIHLSWHFDAVAGEVDRPVCLQSRLTRDYFKGGWTSCYETTGGAVQYSGGFGNSMTPGLMRRLILAYLGNGNLNLGFWTWNARPGGWEAGEYGLTDLAGGVTPWAREAGRLSAAAYRWREELWAAEQEPRVGVLTSWDTDAILSLEPPRHDQVHGIQPFGTGTQHQACKARIGAGRALLNRHIPFEYLTTEELEAGLALRYPTLYVPHARAVSDEAWAALASYVERGGRLVADVQFGFMDAWGKLRPTGPGGRMESLFGAYVATIHDSRTGALAVQGFPVEGFYADLAVTTARVLSRFSTGAPAVTEHAFGKGRAMLVGFDPGRMCTAPGRPQAEGFLADLLDAGQPVGWRCSAPLAFRLTGPAADHYFLLNDGPARTAILDVFDHAYSAAMDAVTGEALPLDGTLAVDLPAESGAWVRMVRAAS